MNLKVIEPHINKNHVLNKIIILSSIDSTNKYLMDNNFASGTIAAAAVQTAGRGKQGAHWQSGSGGLWFSFVINRKIINPYMFVILSSVALVETFAMYGLKPEIKWPNDILLGRLKISGILIENDAYNSKIVTGIGVNINNKAPQNAVSLKQAVHKKINMEEFFIRLVKKLDIYLRQTAGLKKKLIGKWVMNLTDVTGRDVSVIRNKKRVIGKVKKVYKDGSVSIVDEKGNVIRIKGEVFFLA